MFVFILRAILSLKLLWKFLSMKSKMSKSTNLIKIQIHYLHYKHFEIFPL